MQKYKRYRFILLVLLFAIKSGHLFAQHSTSNLTGSNITLEIPNKTISAGILMRLLSAYHPVLEVRVYDLKYGKREQFHQMVSQEIIPLLDRWESVIISYGPSIYDETTYYLIRAYYSPEVRVQNQKFLYESNEWQKSYSESILGMIDNYSILVLHPRKLLHENPLPLMFNNQ